MGCNCGATRSIMRLHGTYGVGKDGRWNDLPILKRYAYTVLLYAAMAVMAPFILAFVLSKVFGDGYIDLSRVLGLGQNASGEDGNVG